MTHHPSKPVETILKASTKAKLGKKSCQAYSRIRVSWTCVCAGLLTYENSHILQLISGNRVGHFRSYIINAFQYDLEPLFLWDSLGHCGQKYRPSFLS